MVFLFNYGDFHGFLLSEKLPEDTRYRRKLAHFHRAPLEDLAVQPQPAAPNGETPWEAPARKRRLRGQGSDKTMTCPEKLYPLVNIQKAMENGHL